MDNKMLAKAIRGKAEEIRDARDADTFELVCVLARVVEGKSLVFVRKADGGEMFPQIAGLAPVKSA
jgi:hypothetical protein